MFPSTAAGRSILMMFAGAPAEYPAHHHHDGQQRNRRAATGGGYRQRSRPRPMSTSTPTRCRPRERLPIDVKRIGCDLLSISGHKMHAPQGVGALYVRKGTALRPHALWRKPRALAAGRHGECSRHRGSGQGGGACAREAFARGDLDRMAALRDRLEQTILRNVEATAVNGHGAPRVPNTTSIYFDCIEGEALVIALDLKGLAVSTGAACSSGAIEPSHVLTAMGLRPEQARGSLRFSLGKQTPPKISNSR